MLGGRQVAFTGRLASMTRADAAELVRARGGEFAPLPTRRTDFLVIGQEGWPLRKDGRLTAKLERARALREAGHPIATLAEEAFLELVGLEERRAAIHTLYTTAQLSRILGVSGDRVRSWVRAELIRPVRTVHRLAYFDFRQVAGARTLCDLAAAGVKLETLRRSLRELAAWMPGVDQPFAQLGILERDGRLMVRLEDGRLADPRGQLYLDLDPPSDGRCEVIPHQPLTAEEWFRIALRHEDAGRLTEAMDSYRRALLLAGPRPELSFNLGNVLYALGRKEQAAERFLQAVEIDPLYVESWNNLGNALADLSRWEEAIDAYGRALAIEPGYADAHYNLAEALLASGRREEAEAHWLAYLDHDPHSSWAEAVKGRLRSPESPTPGAGQVP